MTATTTPQQGDARRNKEGARKGAEKPEKERER